MKMMGMTPGSDMKPAGEMQPGTQMQPGTSTGMDQMQPGG
jgi:hypothetical protein